MALADSLIMELDQEAKTTRRVLDRVPGDKLTWKPHEKSMTLGYLAQHVATIPGAIAQMGTADTMAVESFSKPPEPETAAAILAAFDESLAKAKSILGGMTDAELMTIWTLTKEGEGIFALPRVSLYRALLFNHMYHHRGQLSVYLRLLDIPVPSIYGPSADENPFG